MAAINTEDLFTINAKTNSMKREKLRKDRFQDLRRANLSKTEAILKKRLREKQPAQKVEDPDAQEMLDLWAAPNSKGSKRQHFEDFKLKQMPLVKAVITPLPGQSFNPSAKAHKSVLNKVFEEERTEIEK